MSRVFIPLFALALLASASAESQAAPKAQNGPRCSLTPDQAPAIRGIKLGMSGEEILALFPESKQKPEINWALENTEGYPNYGVARLFFQMLMYPAVAKDRFAGIDGISVTLFDGRVAELRISYAGRDSRPRGPFWPSVDDFIAKLAEAYRLPAAGDWRQVAEADKVLDCDGLDIEASTVSGIASVSLRGGKYLDASRKRAAVTEEKIRKEFKP